METKGRERKPQNSDAAVVAIKKKLATHKMESNRGSGKKCASVFLNGALVAF